VVTIRQLAQRLKVETRTDVAFHCIAIRVMLKTGVNMEEPRNDTDPIALAKVKATLVEMGFQYSLMAD